MLLFKANQAKYESQNMNLFLIVLLIMSEFSLIFVHLDIFHIGFIVPLVVVLAVLIVKIKPSLFDRSVSLYLLPVLLIAGYLFFQPYEYLDGGWDPGNYINTGVHIARTGRITYYDNALKENAKSIGYNRTDIKFPGLYVKDANKGIVVPQFFHLFPVWIALFYKLFGLKSVFYVNPFFAILNVVLLFLIAKEMLGKRYAYLSAILLAFCVIEIWNARFPTSEILGQFYFLTGFYFWIRYIREDDRFFAFWSGMAFGEFLLVGITSLLVIPLIVFYLLFRLKKKDIYFTIPFLTLIIHLVIQITIYSPMYFRSVIMFFTRREIYIALFVCWILLGVILFLRKVSFSKARPYFVVFIFALFVFGYFIRPRLFNSLESLNLIELGSWLSLAGLFTATFGLVLLIWREKDEGLLFITVSAIVFAGFFIFDKRMNSRYPFSLRRYAPAVIPVFCLWVSYFFYILNNRFKRTGFLVSVVLIPLIIIIPVYKCRNVISVKDHKGWMKFWNEFSEKMDNETLYISNNYRWARPLTDIYGKNVIAFAEGAGENVCGFAKNKIGEGKSVSYISDSPKPYSMIVDFEKTDNIACEIECIEDSLTFPPRIEKRKFDFNIFKIRDIGQLTEQEYLVEVGDENIGLLAGFDKARVFGGIDSPARWTFKKAELVVPWFGDNVGQVLTIKVCGMSKEAGISTVSLYIDSVPIAENINIGEEMKEYEVNIPPDIVDTGNNKRAILTIRSNTWSPADYGIKGYPDNLGILLDWVKISVETGSCRNGVIETGSDLEF
jgi:uncharacterized membrane protein (UPF0136 family)